MNFETANIFSRAGNGEILFTLNQPLNLPHQNFYDLNGNMLGFVRGRNIIIYDNYLWNGCSPRVWVYKPLNITIGTPNGPYKLLSYCGVDNVTKLEKLPVTGHASLLHDFLCQFTPEGMTQKEIDYEFFCQLEKVGFKFSRLYWAGVRLFMRFVAKRG